MPNHSRNGYVGDLDIRSASCQWCFSLKIIEKAIVNSDLGLTPNNDGEAIRLTIPQLTSDRRKELSKVVAKLAEEGKVAIRNIRRDAIRTYEKLEKEKKLSEDNVKDLSSDLQCNLRTPCCLYLNFIWLPGQATPSCIVSSLVLKAPQISSLVNLHAMFN